MQTSKPFLNDKIMQIFVALCNTFFKNYRADVKLPHIADPYARICASL